MDEFSMRWEINAPGSADLVWSHKRQVMRVHTTYVGDGLGSLLQAAIDLQKGSSSAIALLPAEPGGTCLFFADALKTVYLQIVSFADMRAAGSRWSGGTLQWADRVGVGQFIRETILLAERVLGQYEGVAGYSKSWGGSPFPLQKLETLRRYL